ncbi:MAG: Fur family transcriptional regulator [Anaerolineae bacterium]|jgi:Fur family ferric uptake transcriptional regulator|nr:Fur family transcriptional regulator [Anaerolineae bacterium]
MTCEEVLRQTLKQHGYRMTHQREAVLNAMHTAHGAITAESIYARAAQDCKVLNLSTVYRTLDLFQQFGLVSVIDAHGIHYFEHVGLQEPHLHLRCSQCGKIFNIALEEAQPLLEAFTAQYHFQVDLTEITFQGVCAACQLNACKT